MQNQDMELDEFLDEDMLKSIQEELEKEQNQVQNQNNQDAKEEPNENKNTKTNKKENKKKKTNNNKDLTHIEEESKEPEGEFEKERKKRDSKPKKKGKSSKPKEENATTIKMDVELPEEPKKDKKGKKKKEKENADGTKKLKEDISTLDNSNLEAKENAETDGQAKDEKKKKKNKNKNNNTSVNKEMDQEEVVEEKLSKIKIEEGDKNDPKQAVLNYLITQNRPYSFINIFDNLRGAIKKSLLQKILDSLVDDTKIICKEYNSKIYLASQKNFPVIDEREMKKLDDAIEETNQKLTDQKAEISLLNLDLRQNTSQPTTNQITIDIATFEEKVRKLKEVICENEKQNIQMIDPEQMKIAEKKYEEDKLKCKKIKKACIDIIDNFSECMEKNTKEIMELIGLEEDTEILATLKNKNF